MTLGRAVPSGFSSLSWAGADRCHRLIFYNYKSFQPIDDVENAKPTLRPIVRNLKKISPTSFKLISL